MSWEFDGIEDDFYKQYNTNSKFDDFDGEDDWNTTIESPR